MVISTYGRRLQCYVQPSEFDLSHSSASIIWFKLLGMLSQAFQITADALFESSHSHQEIACRVNVKLQCQLLAPYPDRYYIWKGKRRHKFINILYDIYRNTQSKPTLWKSVTACHEPLGFIYHMLYVHRRPGVVRRQLLIVQRHNPTNCPTVINRHNIYSINSSYTKLMWPT